MRIDQAGKPLPSAASARARRAQGGFALPETAESEAGDAAETPQAPSGITSILLAGMEPVTQEKPDDAAAARHGGAMLKALSDLQRALLEGEGNEACRTLATLAQSMPTASDPGLQDALQSVALRAAVELARIS